METEPTNHLEIVNRILRSATPDEANAVKKCLYFNENSNDHFLPCYAMLQDTRLSPDAPCLKTIEQRDILVDMCADHPTVRAILYRQGFKDQSVFSAKTIELLDDAGKQYFKEYVGRNTALRFDN